MRRMSGFMFLYYVVKCTGRLSQQWRPRASRIRCTATTSDVDLAIGVCEVLNSVRNRIDALVCIRDSSIKSAGRGLFSCADLKTNTCVALYPGSYVPPLPPFAVGGPSGDVVLKPGELGFVDERGMCFC